jgi:hypothetical protein
MLTAPTTTPRHGAQGMIKKDKLFAGLLQSPVLNERDRVGECTSELRFPTDSTSLFSLSSLSNLVGSRPRKQRTYLRCV